MSAHRREIFTNRGTSTEFADNTDRARIRRFHAELPGYEISPLISAQHIARRLDVKAVMIKDESNRFRLPSFKILGASWGCFRALAAKVGLGLDSSLGAIRDSLRQNPEILFAATDGNHGQAVAFMASTLGISSKIFVPSSLSYMAKQAIIEQGGDVVEVSGDYDQTVHKAFAEASKADGILIQDTAWDEYQEIPSWIVDGYSTIFSELEEQMLSIGAEKLVVIAPVGVGSLAHSIVKNVKSRHRASTVVAVEPDTAPCLWTSLMARKSVTIRTSPTIMTGMDCGTVSASAFEALRDHIDHSLTVSDFEAHSAVQELAVSGVPAGPCGAAGLAAASRLASAGLLDPTSVVVLINTERTRAYPEPYDVSIEDVVGLTQILTRIESTNPTLSSALGVGEQNIIDYIEAWLRHRDITTHRLASNPTRPSVIGVVQGMGDGNRLMINGHVDTVSLAGYSRHPLGGKLEQRNGRKVVTGRGALDMKAGIALGMMSLLWAKITPLRGDVVLAAVADEEDTSIGTRELLAAGWRADAAIITEPTQTELVIAHKGFLWLEVTFCGYAAHGSDARTGRDAILMAGVFLEALREYQQFLPADSLLGQGTLHCGRIDGGEENSTYPASCTLTIEFRTVPPQSGDSVLHDVKQILCRLATRNEHFSYTDPRVILERPSHSLCEDHELVRTIAKAGQVVLHRELVIAGSPGWCDAALLANSGIPTAIIGPSGFGLHGDDEFVDVTSMQQTQAILYRVIEDFCGRVR